MSDRPSPIAATLDAVPLGSQVPAETDPHTYTLIAWPTEARREQLWGDQLDAARQVHALLANVIARFEPVILVADPTDLDDVTRGVVDDRIEILGAEIDDSWMRDSGPVITVAPDGSRHALCFRFTGWGGSFVPFDHDATIATRLAEHLGLPAYDLGIAGEGGALALDGTGTVVTTERCLLNPNRNPDLTRADIDTVIYRSIGAGPIVWLADGIAEDEGTDGHVDNVVAFHTPGRCLLQGCDDPTNPNHDLARANRERLVRAGIQVTEVPVLPYADIGGQRVPVPYVNLYPVNGAVLVPISGDPADAPMLEIIGRCFPEREVIGVPGAVLAFGGGGVHCITQPVPQ